MVLLIIVAIFSLFSLGSASSSSCLSTDSADRCSDSTANNDPILTTKDSCSAPPDRNTTVKQCGQDNISYDECYQAGCCYQGGQCFVPFVEERVDFLFFEEKVQFWEAYRKCRNSGLYKLPCVVDVFDYKRVASRSCGKVWLGGAITNRNAERSWCQKWDREECQQGHPAQIGAVAFWCPQFTVVAWGPVPAPKVPFYNQTLDDCSSKIGVSCKLFPRDYALALQPNKDDSFFLSSVHMSEMRPFLCIKEQWRPHLTDYPGNVASEDPNKIMLCGLIFSGNVTTQNLAVEWRMIHPNGTAVQLKYKVYKNRQQVAAQYYADSIKTLIPGKYICSFSFLDKEGVKTERRGWAYHYTEISCNVSVQGVLYLKQSLIELAVEYNSDISIDVACSGYPLPEIHWTDDVNGQGHVTRKTVQSGETLPISKLEALAALHEEITYTVNLQPKSDITTLPSTTIRITKLPIPTECYVTLVTEEEHLFRFTEEVVHRTVKTGGSFDVIFECFGFPKSNMTIVKTTRGMEELLVEDLTSDIFHTVGHWIFEDFATEVARTKEYEMTLNMTVTPPGGTPSTLTLILTKETISPSCSFQLINNGAEIHEHTALDVQDFHRVNESSFSGQSFELAVSCSGFPAPEITAVILAKKEGSDPTEMKLGPYVQHFDWILNSFASEATVAQDFSQTVTITARSGDHQPVIMVVNLIKTIIMFAMEDLPNDTQTIRNLEYEVEEGATLEQVVANQIELPCKGASGPGFPTPSAFWEYNDQRLDLRTEIGEHIEFKNRSSEVDSTIIVSTLSSIVAGLYRCVILIDNKFTKNYTTSLMMERPPVAPGQTLITEIKDNKRVVAASSLQPSYEYLGNVSFKSFLFSGDVLLEKTSNTTISGGKVYGEFNLPESGVIKMGFTASNEYGESEMSQKSDELEILPGTPRSSVSKISRTEEATAEAFSSLSLTFDEIPEVEEYDVKLYNASNGALKGEFTFPENKVVIEELEPQTSYLVKVRGVKTMEGEKVYGPSSLASSFTTAPRELPAPSNLQGRPLESEGNTSAVLLTWDVAEVGAEFIDGYILYISLVRDQPEDSGEGRRKRQALQTVTSVHIPFGARAKVIKDLDSGTRYEFILQSYSSDFGESEPAKVTVQTLTGGPCPYTLPERYPPRHCPPRVSIDRKYLYIKFYFDCYNGEGLDFRGKHSTTHQNESCAPWTKDNLKQFQHLDDLPEIGTNYCRNFEGSKENKTSNHSKPWCYLSDGSNATCSLRQCHPIKDDTCYTETGQNFQGQGYTEKCVNWTETALQQNLLSDYPQQIIGSVTCRNWEGTNMTEPWCFTADGHKEKCSVPPCGSGDVTVNFGQSEIPQRSYIVNDKQDSLCIKLEGSEDVRVGVKHTFGVKECESKEISRPEVIIPKRTRTTDRLWVRYLIVELVLTVLVGSLWLFLLYRRRIISRQSSVTNGRTSATNVDTKKEKVVGRDRFIPRSQKDAYSSLGGL